LTMTTLSTYGSGYVLGAGCGPRHRQRTGASIRAGEATLKAP
jgi:hypothetical protein